MNEGRGLVGGNEVGGALPVCKCRNITDLLHVPDCVKFSVNHYLDVL